MHEPALDTRSNGRIDFPSDVHCRIWDDHKGLPLVIEPKHGETDLATWLGDHRDAALAARREHGAVLFRGFHVSEAARTRTGTWGARAGPMSCPANSLTLRAASAAPGGVAKPRRSPC